MTVKEGFANNNTDYVIQTALTWNQTTNAHGTFTLTSPDSFTVDASLADNLTATYANSWNGKDLTKVGSGTLILSAANSYTGLTDIQAGTLALSGAGCIAASSQVQVASNCHVRHWRYR
jgi:autotransporter-associated beta strand protein